MRLHGRAEPHVGQRWTDITMAGVRPRMQTTVLDPYRLFEEQGRWHGVRATLAMRFVASGHGCRVTVAGTLSGSRGWSAVAAGAARMARIGIRSDLERAGRILADRGPR